MEIAELIKVDTNTEKKINNVTIMSLQKKSISIDSETKIKDLRDHSGSFGTMLKFEDIVEAKLPCIVAWGINDYDGLILVDDTHIVRTALSESY